MRSLKLYTVPKENEVFLKTLGTLVPAKNHYAEFAMYLFSEFGLMLNFLLHACDKL